MAVLVPTRTAALVLRCMVPCVGTDQLSQVIAEFAFAKLTWKHAFANYNTEAMTHYVVSSLLARYGPDQDIPKINRSRTSIMDHAVSCGFTSVVRLLHHSDCVRHCTVHAIGLAAECGHLEIVQFFHNEHHTSDDTCFSKTAVTSAGQYGHLEVVQYLHQVAHAPFDKQAWETAAYAGQLQIVQYWYHQSLLIDSDSTSITDARVLWSIQRVMTLAAFQGHAEIVAWLMEQQGSNNNTQRGDGVFVGAARNGHLHVIQRLHALNTAGWSPRVMDAAAQCGRLKIVEFLHTHRTEGCTTEAMDGAALAGKMEIVEFLHGNRHEGCTRAAMDNAASRGHLEIVQFLHENRTEGCTDEALASAAENRNLEMVQFLVENRSEGCVKQAIDKIVNHDWHYCHGFHSHKDALVLGYLYSKPCRAHCSMCGDPEFRENGE